MLSIFLPLFCLYFVCSFLAKCIPQFPEGSEEMLNFGQILEKSQSSALKVGTLTFASFAWTWQVLPKDLPSTKYI